MPAPPPVVLLRSWSDSRHILVNADAVVQTVDSVVKKTQPSRIRYSALEGLGARRTGKLTNCSGRSDEL